MNEVTVATGEEGERMIEVPPIGIYAAIAAAMKDIGPIAKGRKLT